MVEDAITWVPPMDVYESGGDYVVCAELPGVDLRDVHIEFSGLQVTVRGERRLESGCLRENYRRLEGPRGKFHRTFSLPEAVDRGRILCELRDGLLHVILPKAGGASRRRPEENR